MSKKKLKPKSKTKRKPAQSKTKKNKDGVCTARNWVNGEDMESYAHKRKKLAEPNKRNGNRR